MTDDGQPVGYVCPLTADQMRVTKLFAIGLSGKKVAHELKMHEARVARLCASACEACGANNRTHLVAILLRRGWIQ